MERKFQELLAGMIDPQVIEAVLAVHEFYQKHTPDPIMVIPITITDLGSFEIIVRKRLDQSLIAGQTQTRACCGGQHR